MPVSADMRTLTRAERLTTGAELRARVKRSAHGAWAAPAGRRDPVEILIEQERHRIPSLLPLRHARMQTDPFAFLRGAAAIMAADLALTPTTGIRVQSSGDCHLANFGSFATPEGQAAFDLNDFDETLPAPFEWDLKRLAASLAVAGRVASLGDRACQALASAAARAYRMHMAELAAMPPLAAWNARIDLKAAIAGVEQSRIRKPLEARLARILESNTALFGLVDPAAAARAIRERPPLISHDAGFDATAAAALRAYGATLAEERRSLLDLHVLRDTAFKVVGVGSVGTFCAIGLLAADDGSPLLLQVKEAQDSVLAPHAGASSYANQGQRVVAGQRLLQAASDIFLGWTPEPIDGRFFYVRRLKDHRLADIGETIASALPFTAQLTGRTLARAHARSGKAPEIAGYLGDTDIFDDAIGNFASAYAAQTDRDWHVFRDAIATGRIAAASA